MSQSYDKDLSKFVKKLLAAGKKMRPKSGKPLGEKTTATMTAAEINKELDKRNAQDSTLGGRMIEAGRGHERPSKYLGMTDPRRNRRAQFSTVG